jgi:hypothetical protein
MRPLLDWFFSSLGTFSRTFFDYFRWASFIFVTVYFVVTTAKSAWEYYVWLSAKDRYTGLLRNYIFVQGLRLRVRTFGMDLVICGLLCVAFLLMWRANVVLSQISSIVHSIPQTP